MQRHGLLVAGIDGNVALDAHGGRVRHEDQTTFSAMNPGLVRRIGEGNMREAGEEDNVLHSRRPMGPAIEFGREDGVGCVCDVTELFDGGACGSSLTGHGELIGELPAFECRLAIGSGYGGEI